VTGEPRGLRIGEVAERTGTTPRTIRYYEEIGLLPAVSLEELRELVAAETARAELRSEWHSRQASPARQRAILEEALGHVERQLELVAGRRREIARLEEELSAKRERLRSRLAELERAPAGRG
jgi:DNA-binding transcriptional MerR regulator